MSGQRLSDDSGDKKYFVISPQIVWALCQDPYEYTLWSVVKMVAGDAGECFLTTGDLASLSMMSTGKVSTCRKRLLEIGLLKGSLHKDPNYPQPVWHLSIPDLWSQNVSWRAGLGDRLASRVGLKQTQKKLKKGRDTGKEPSPGEKGLTPGEEPSPGEEGLTPGETKENQKEEPITDSELFEELFGQDPLTEETEYIDRTDPDVRNKRIIAATQKFAERVGQSPWMHWYPDRIYPRGGIDKQHIQHVSWLINEITGIHPKSDAVWKRWRPAYESMYKEAQGNFEIIEEAIKSKWPGEVQYRSSVPSKYTEAVTKIAADWESRKPKRQSRKVWEM